MTIEDIAFGGEGVGRMEDFVVFVPFVLVGETVEAEITEVKKNFARSKLLRVEKPSPQRVEPQCVYFGKCGGCQYQHMAYDEQLRMKRKQIADLFERVGKISKDIVEPVIPCPSPYGYRNRIMVRSQWNKPEQKLNIGFIRGDCGLVEDIEKCVIAEPAINEQLEQVRAHPPPKGGIKVVLRVQPEDWELPQDSFSKIISSCCRRWWKQCAAFCRRAGPGTWQIYIAVWDFSELNWPTPLKALPAWNTTGARSRQHKKTRHRATLPTGNLFRPKLKKFCRNC